MARAPEQGLPARAIEDEAERIALVRLARSENVGPATFGDLLARFGSAARALDALPELAARGGRRSIAVCSRAAAEDEIAAVEGLGARLVILSAPDYPPRLAAIDAPPPVLSVAGDPAVLARPSVAVVGSRNASLSGRRIARDLSRAFGAAGLVVVSGLAHGIDGAAHEAALSTGTVAVLAGGIDVVYPADHADLAATILEQGGAVASEMPLGWQARAVDFPRRNRIVSGLSLGVVVVEAARRSGTIHTARFALDQGRDVFAVPGSPRDPRAEGCNALIKEGAGLVTDADDVIGALRWQSRTAEGPPVPIGLAEDGIAGWPPAPPALPAPREAALAGRTVRAVLGAAPVAIDEVVRDTGLSVGAVQLAILELDLAGRIERHAGGRVSLIA